MADPTINAIEQYYSFAKIQIILTYQQIIVKFNNYNLQKIALQVAVLFFLHLFTINVLNLYFP